MIVNDMGEVNVDAELVAQNGSLNHVDEKLVEMTNGCICCTLREDLLIEVGRLAREGRFDYTEAASLKEKDLAIAPEDERNVATLLIDQVEFCNVIVLSKTDLVSHRQLAELRATLERLNPRARIVDAQWGRVPLDSILGPRSFDLEEAARAPGWLPELRGEHVPETEEYGIASFVYRARRPFHPQRLYRFLARGWRYGNLIRSKGYFWLATQYDQAGSWSQAGGIMNHGFAGLFWAAVRDDHWPEDPQFRARIRESWASPFGDRRQELVFIGQGLDEARARAALDACLLNDAELERGPSGWRDLDDPFPQWLQMVDEDECEEVTP